MSEKKVALAVGAHPDDVEFLMAGTLALLGDAGYELAHHDHRQRELRHRRTHA
jgi:LmbE family N-acetylglucosaminyl deacetylase